MNLEKPVFALSKSEAASILARFGKLNSVKTTGKNFISLLAENEVKFYIMPATSSLAGEWSEDICTDCIVFYAYLHNNPFCRVAFDLTDGMTGVELIHAITSKIIVPLITRSPSLYDKNVLNSSLTFERFSSTG